MGTNGSHPRSSGKNSGVVQVTWFEIGNKVEWVNKKGITMNGEIIAILEPGEVAEDVLDEKERTKLSTTNLGAAVIPETRRALIRVYDENGWVTYHTKRLGTLTKLIEMEHEQEVTINDLMKEIREIKDIIGRQESERGNARLRTVTRNDNIR